MAVQLYGVEMPSNNNIPKPQLPSMCFKLLNTKFYISVSNAPHGCFLSFALCLFADWLEVG